jgi:SusD family.
MKKINNYLLTLAGMMLVIILATSCDDFLDRQEDETLTFDKIWESRDNTRKYWLNAMSFIPNEVMDYSGNDPFTGASDESTIAYGKDYNKINFGSWNPVDMPFSDQRFNFSSLYKGIRECNIFLANVDRSSDPLTTKEDIATWKIQTRFARAYYYFCLIRLYGPVFLLNDEILDFSASTEELYRPRNTWEECVNYVISELEACIADPGMKSGYSSNSDYGLSTKGACQAVIARLRLYSARPLFNGNPLYQNVKNPVTDAFPELSGVNLFPTSFDANKWKVAADAAKVLIDNPQYKLYRAGNNNPYEDYYGVTQQNWNEEIIWSTGYKSRYNIGVSCVPTAIAGTAYGATGPTQQQVDAYAMNNGIYPITGYDKSGEPVIDEKSEYPTDELVKENWTYPAWGGVAAYNVNLPVMFKDREPRFYVNVFFSGLTWIHGNGRTLISFAKGGNSNKSHDYTKSGYMVNRFYDHRENSAQGNWGNITFPTFRLAEMYLNFIEATLECKKNGINTGYENQAMEVWDDLRDRAGLPSILEVYPGATTEKLIELCRQERRVEMSFESQRFFDTRTWMIATTVNNGSMYGMNASFPIEDGKPNETPDGFWERTVFENRVFRDKHYLFPFAQRELDRNKLLTQNYGW